MKLNDERAKDDPYGTGLTRRELFSATAIAALPAASPALTGTKPSTYFPPPDSEGGWRTLTDAASIRKKAGMDLTRLEQAWEFTQRCCPNVGLGGWRRR